MVESEDVTGDDLLLFGGRTVNEDLFDILVSAVFLFSPLVDLRNVLFILYFGIVRPSSRKLDISFL